MNISPDGGKYYPRVLLVNSEPISKRYATGITMGNLFRGWPRDRIAQIYCDNSIPDESICDKSWHMEIHDLNMPGWLRKIIIAKRKQKYQAVTQDKPAQPETICAGDMKTAVVRILKSAFLRSLNFSSYRISQELDAWIREFKPDIIYSTLGNLNMLKLVQDISGSLMVPVVPHFMDDWIVSLHSETLRDKYLKPRLLKKTRQIMLNAPVMLVISEAMAEEYRKRYGRTFLPFMNCIDCEAYKSIARQPRNAESFRLVYAGGLHLGRFEMLLEVARALEAFKAVLDIYTPVTLASVIEEAKLYPAIRLRGAISPENAAAIFINCDGLLHVESFEEAHKAYTRFSVSTKLPEYFGSGTPVFAYGPADIASIQYISVNNCGIVATEHDQNLLKNKLKEFICDEKVRMEAAGNAVKLCAANHEAVSQREKFREAFASCVKP